MTISQSVRAADRRQRRLLLQQRAPSCRWETAASHSKRMGELYEAMRRENPVNYVVISITYSRFCSARCAKHIPVDGRVFPITENALKGAFERARKRAGLEYFRLHDTRHE